MSITSPRVLLTIAVAACLAACSGQEAPTASDDQTTTPAPADQAPAPAVDEDAQAAQEAPAPAEDADVPAGFDLHALPVSDAALGAFPFFSIPEGYSASSNNTRTLEFGEAVFWNGHDLSAVEGRVYAAGIRLDRAMRGQKQFSDLEVTRNLREVVLQAGGVALASGQLPAALVATMQDTMRQYPGESTCYHNSEREVFVLRRDDGNVWVATCRGRTHAGLIVLQEQPLQVSSTLLPASALQQALDADGRVALQVNFATDSADILPASQPQIDEILGLLQADPDLQLSIEGHTDNTGGAAHNQQLSQARAAAVVAALTGAGIDAARLESAGLGQSQPVADNQTEEGRARNRRVELVRRD